MKCKKDGGMWWLLVRLFYQASYYWEWLGFVIWRLYCRATSGVRGETPMQRRPLHVLLLPPSIFTGPNLSIFCTKACPHKEQLVLGLVYGSRVILHAASFECLAAGLPSFNPSHANYSPPFSTCMPNHNSSNHACLGWNIELAPPLKIRWCYASMKINATDIAFSRWRDHARLAREN